jgi:hypothetical protein
MRLLLCLLLGSGALAGTACSAKVTSTSGAGGATATTSSAATGGTPCGSAVCTVDQTCGYPVGTCSGTKSCQPATSCMDEKVVCGCDGMNYANQCDAEHLGGGTMSAAACAPPAGKFTCIYEYQVPKYCTLGAEYCHITATGDLYTLACVPLPASCGASPTDCSCLQDACATNSCAIDKSNFSITVLCPLAG